MRKILCLSLIAVTLTGCKLSDENPHWAPQQDYPEWAYDAPFYYRPTEELRPMEIEGKEIPVYYTRSRFFFIKHPENHQLTGDPRIAVWVSTDEGKNWQRSGFFGVEQTHFIQEAEQDGRHWIRFVGPGQTATKGPVPTPHRIYVVDTKGPLLAIKVHPAPWDDKEKKVPHVYRPGEEITLGWAVKDPNLQAKTIKLESCHGKEPLELKWVTFRGAIPPVGNRRVVVPPEAARDGHIRFRIEAEDKAGNVSAAITVPLLVRLDPKVAKDPATMPHPTTDVMPSEPTDMEKSARPGWPEAGTLLRGGSVQVLNWMPAVADDYDNISLELTFNNSLTWRPIAEELTPGKATVWKVPELTSRFCRIRLVAMDKGSKILLAQSAMFRIATIETDEKEGPKVVEVEEEEKPSSDDAQ